MSPGRSLRGRLNRPQRFALLGGLLVVLVAAAVALLPFRLNGRLRLDCAPAAVAVFEREDSTEDDTGRFPVFRDDDSESVPLRTGPQPTLCALEAGRRLQAAGIVAGLGLIGAFVGVAILADRERR